MIILQKSFMRNSRFRVFFLLLFGLIVWVCYLWLFLGFIPSQRELVENFYISPTFYDRNNTLLAARLSVNEEWLLPIPLKDMGNWLPKIVVVVEDGRFYSHHGLDVLALFRAFGQNIKAKKVISGASTISSQLIRLSQPRERNLKAKFLEFLQAIKLEQELSKDEILELYLNRAPFGGTLRGVEAASRQYFGKRAKELSLSESVMLIALLRGPTYYRPDRNEDALKKRRDQILTLLAQKNIISNKDLELAKAERIPLVKYQMPTETRHYTDLVLETLSKEDFKWLKNKQRFGIITSLDLDQQHYIERFLANYLSAYSPDLTAALAVLDNNSGEILAYVGNAQYKHGEDKNWVDCIRAKRSPGSILKPFIYLSAFERGFYIPASLIADSPLALSGNAPRNFDEKYRGPVSVRFALSESLNAPAIRVLRKVGYEDSLSILRSLGFSSLTQKSSFYGDSLILGGCEVNLLQVLNAYSVLARLGIPKELVLTKIQQSNKEKLENTANNEQPLRLAIKNSDLGTKPLFSESASWLIAETLRSKEKVSALINVNINAVPDIAFKTGTSFGLRDAWCAAYNPQYTVVVWFGDPKGKADKDLIGVHIAAPMALKVLNNFIQGYKKNKTKNNIVNANNQHWFNRPESIEEFSACSISGQSVTPQCPQTVLALRIKNVSQTRPCALHSHIEAVGTILWPAELADFAFKYKEQVKSNTKIQITSPLPASKIFIRKDVKNQKIPLVCEGMTGKVFWYIDKSFFAVQERGEALLWEMTEGRHTLTVLDEAGKTYKTEINVVAIGGDAAPNSLLPILEIEKTE